MSDPLPGLSALDCDPAALDPGEVLTCSATYTVTQADMDAGLVANTAGAEGTDPSGGQTSGSGSATVVATPAPAVTLEKSVELPAHAEFGIVRPGDVLTYTMVATNTGNVTLLGAEIVDPLPGLGRLVCDPPQPTDLAPGEALTCEAE